MTANMDSFNIAIETRLEPETLSRLKSFAITGPLLRSRLYNEWKDLIYRSIDARIEG